MTTRQVIVAALVLGFICCAIMWWLEGFRQRQMISTFQEWLDGLPTFGGRESAG